MGQSKKTTVWIFLLLLIILLYATYNYISYSKEVGLENTLSSLSLSNWTKSEVKDSNISVPGAVESLEVSWHQQKQIESAKGNFLYTYPYGITLEAQAFVINAPTQAQVAKIFGPEYQFQNDYNLGGMIVKRYFVLVERPVPSFLNRTINQTNTYYYLDIFKKGNTLFELKYRQDYKTDANILVNELFGKNSLT